MSSLKFKICEYLMVENELLQYIILIFEYGEIYLM